MHACRSTLEDPTIDADEARASIQVSDDGKGMSPEFLPYVFDRFRQADSSSTRAHGGLGLGLSIVRHLVELHGGTARAESAGPSLGSTFTVSFPVLTMPRIAERGAARETPGPGDRLRGAVRVDGIRVMIVDDEPDARELLGDVLREHGAVVATYGSAEEALAAIADFGPEVLLSDIGMPGEDGFELIRKLRALEGPVARVPAVALTAYARPEDGRRMLQAGFQVHVAKPVDPATLTSIVSGLGAVRRE